MCRSLYRYVWEEVGMPYGVMSLQGAEQKNGEYRTDLSSRGCTNHWMSETILKRNKFCQRTSREFRSLFLILIFGELCLAPSQVRGPMFPLPRVRPSQTDVSAQDAHGLGVSAARTCRSRVSGVASERVVWKSPLIHSHWRRHAAPPASHSS